MHVFYCHYHFDYLTHLQYRFLISLPEPVALTVSSPFKVSTVPRYSYRFLRILWCHVPKRLCIPRPTTITSGTSALKIHKIAGQLGMAVNKKFTNGRSIRIAKVEEVKTHVRFQFTDRTGHRPSLLSLLGWCKC